MSPLSGHLKKWLFASLITASLSSTAFAGTLYVKNSGTRVHEEASARSTPIETLDAGAPVTVNKTGEDFYQVTTASGKKGYVFKFKLDEIFSKEEKNLSGLPANKMKVVERPPSSSIRGERNSPKRPEK